MRKAQRGSVAAVWARGAVVASVLVFAVGACGSDDSPADTGGKCSPVGATQACTGPGACAGGQVCGADGTWGACDCGGGGSAGADGGSGTGGVAGSSAGAGGAAASGGQSGSGGSSGASGSAGAAGSGAGCPGTAGPTMVNIGAFCIDSTEVTRAQYAEFLIAKGSDLTGQPADCFNNLNFVPGLAVSETACATGAFDPTTNPNHPVTCVDWCDAATYCSWAGKRLCGDLAGGVPSGPPGAGEWYYVCSQGGTTDYPYGGTSDPSACVTAPQSTALAPVKSKPGCTGQSQPFNDVYDISGNAAEWTRKPPLADPEAWGASYRALSTAKCGIWGTAKVLQMYPELGFRCCADSK